MTDFSGLVGKTFSANQVSRGTLSTGPTGFYKFNELNTLANQSVTIGTYGSDATITFTSVAPSGGFINFSANVKSSNYFANGYSINGITVTGNFLGNDATDFLLNAQGLAGLGSAFLYVTNTVAQQPGTVAPNNTANVNGASTGNPYTPPACFAQGTMIATTRGPVAVENLSVGDRVAVHDGDRGIVATVARPVVWLGHRQIDCGSHPRPWDVLPVRVSAGAFADGQPCRDLLLSPDHAVFAGGVLIPIRHLVNDATITQKPVPSVTYWHVELDAHDVILADGLPVESYLDTGNRAAFANAPISQRVPAFVGAQPWDGCLPLVESGTIVEGVRALLDRRAGPLLPSSETLTIAAPGLHTTLLPAGATRLRLVSPAMRPSEDGRRLGVAVAAIHLDGTPLPLESPVLAAGFHARESGWRWTNGEALLQLEPCVLPREIRVETVMLAA